MSYVLSFTGMSLNFYETQEVSKIYLQTSDWQETEKIVIENNVLQRKTLASSKRFFREIKNRVDKLNIDELNYFVSDESDVKYLATLSCFKLYKFIYDFEIEVVYDKFLKGDLMIFESDFNNFVESKKLFYDNLNKITSSTRYKIRQVMFKILYESDLLTSTKEKKISKPFLSNKLLKIIKEDNPNYLYLFLLTKDEIERV